MGSIYIQNYLNDVMAEIFSGLFDIIEIILVKITFAGGGKQSSSPTISRIFTSSSFLTTYI